jgi:hypothetical protein
MFPPSQLSLWMSLPIQLKQALALLHSLWWWQLPSQSPIVDPSARYVV